MVGFFLFALILIVVLCFFSLFTVKQQSVAVIERLGKFSRTASPGLNFKIPFIEHVAGRVHLQVMPLNVVVETKTKDNVFAQLNVSVQLMAKPEKIYEAFYKLLNYQEQIKAFVFDVVRAQVPKLDLDEVFEKKDDIAKAVKDELSETMDQFGYAILNALVTDINPDDTVKTAMNEINAAQRLRVAATEKGEAEKILKIKQAEAEAESMKLQGQGLANARKAIIDGIKCSVADFKEVSPDLEVKDVMTRRCCITL